MIKTTQKIYNLNEVQTIWLREGEDFLATLSFGGEDMSGSSFRFDYVERAWSYAPSSYDTVKSGTLDGVFDISDAENGNVSINIDKDIIASWYGRQMRFTIVLDDSWVAVEGTISILRGE